MATLLNKSDVSSVRITACVSMLVAETYNSLLTFGKYISTHTQVHTHTHTNAHTHTHTHTSLHGAVRGFNTPCVDCGKSSLQHQASLSALVPPTFSSDCVSTHIVDLWYWHSVAMCCVQSVYQCCYPTQCCQSCSRRSW